VLSCLRTKLRFFLLSILPPAKYSQSRSLELSRPASRDSKAVSFVLKEWPWCDDKGRGGSCAGFCGELIVQPRSNDGVFL
jgi:hypothetical protein